jgi:nucleotidyltransferase/DNA polymerase involved in DNA repair
MQLHLQTLSREQLKNTWAFAAYKGRPKRKLTKTNQAIITACSKQARSIGIEVGMRVQDARLLLPNLKVLTYAGG